MKSIAQKFHKICIKIIDIRTAVELLDINILIEKV